MGPRVVSALLALRPGLTATLEELLAPRGRALSGEESERLALEKDAVGVILDIALDDARDMLLDWAPVQPGEPFLRGVRHRVAHENYLISHDATRFEDWLPLNTGEVDWRTFTKGGRSFRILNANNGPMERDLGIDLIYFNETLRSFVLVQYKKMTPGADGELWYRGDRRLDSQLERMRAIDNATSGVATSESDFRLYPMPCFLKLCEPYALVPDSEALIRGMYLARGHFEQFWSDTTLWGPKGGTRLGYRNVHRRLSNTQFTRLVKAAGSAAGVQRRKR